MTSINVFFFALHIFYFAVLCILTTNFNTFACPGKANPPARPGRAVEAGSSGEKAGNPVQQGKSDGGAGLAGRRL